MKIKIYPHLYPHIIKVTPLIYDLINKKGQYQTSLLVP